MTIFVTDIVQLYDCRIALEPLSVAGACENANSFQLQALEKCVLQAEQLIQHQTSESNSFQLLNLEYQFHYLIATSSGNKWLLPLLERIFDKMTLLWFQTTYYNSRVLVSWTEHRQIYEAIARRDVRGATQAIHCHLNGSKARAIQELHYFQQHEQYD